MAAHRKQPSALSAGRRNLHHRVPVGSPCARTDGRAGTRVRTRTGRRTRHRADAGSATRSGVAGHGTDVRPQAPAGREEQPALRPGLGAQRRARSPNGQTLVRCRGVDVPVVAEQQVGPDDAASGRTWRNKILAGRPRQTRCHDGLAPRLVRRRRKIRLSGLQRRRFPGRLLRCRAEPGLCAPHRTQPQPAYGIHVGSRLPAFEL